MRTKIRRLALLGMLMGALLGTGLMAPASAAGTMQLGGDAVFDTTVCDSPPEGFMSYPGLRLTGSLEGCLYTGVVDSQFTPSGGYIETGHEMFVGSLNDGATGTFTTNYRFQGKYEADFTVEIHGRCQHPITAGSGTDAFAGVTGRLNFKDDVDNATFYYRGHLTLG